MQQHLLHVATKPVPVPVSGDTCGTKTCTMCTGLAEAEAESAQASHLDASEPATRTH